MVFLSYPLDIRVENWVTTLLFTVDHHGVPEQLRNYLPKKYFSQNYLLFNHFNFFLSGSDGSRQPSTLELEVAEFQGFEFGSLMKRVVSH
jgi:hypothetical protein